MRKYIRRDKNHVEIAKALQQRGVYVLDLATSGGGVTDIVTHHKGRTVFIEIKAEGRHSHIEKTQMKFLGEFPGYCGIARTEDEAYKIATDPEGYGLSQAQKDRLLIHHREMKAQVKSNTVFKMLAER